MERAFHEFHTHYHRERDPVSIVHRYEDPRDQEVVALFAACLSYGNVQTILKSLQYVVTHLGKHPSRALLEESGVPFGQFRHRFTTGKDLEVLAAWIGGALRSHGSIENFFAAQQSHNQKERIESFVYRFTSQKIPKELRAIAGRRVQGLKYLLPTPSRGSACKRLNLYLRWMVRKNDGIDLGIWSSLDPAELILPLDTHLLRIIRDLGWSKSKQANWKTAEEATCKIRQLYPLDPVRCDFALCHLSMSGFRIHEWEINAPLE